MASPKPAPKDPVKANYICSECEIEFRGTSCPECGNRKGNKKLATDGIPQEQHKPEYVLGLEPVRDEYGNALSDDFLLSIQDAKVANEEFKDNMRSARVMASEVKRLDAEKKLLSKQREVDQFRDGPPDGYLPEKPVLEVPGMPQTPLFGSQSPQAQFMSQLMKMDNEKRGEFIEQLSDADPQALNTMQSMFTPPVQNPMGYPGASVGMYPPPWQAAPQPQTALPESPMVLMKEMFQLMKENQPEKDNTASELLREFKDEFKSIHSRIDSIIQDKANHDSSQEPLIQYMQQLENKIDEAQKAPDIKQQLHAIKDMADDMKDLGLINSGDPTAPLTDQIEMKKLDHDIDMDKKQFDIDQERNEIDRASQHTREQLVQQLFSKGLSGSQEVVVEAPPVQPRSPNPTPLRTSASVQKPANVVDVIESDAGQICEVRTHGSSDEDGV